MHMLLRALAPVPSPFPLPPQLPDPEEVVKARQRAEERRRKFTSLPEASGRLADPGGGAAAARRKALAGRLGVGAKSQVGQGACGRLGVGAKSQVGQGACGRLGGGAAGKQQGRRGGRAQGVREPGVWAQGACGARPWRGGWGHPRARCDWGHVSASRA